MDESIFTCSQLSIFPSNANASSRQQVQMKEDATRGVPKSGLVRSLSALLPTPYTPREGENLCSVAHHVMT